MGCAENTHVNTEKFSSELSCGQADCACGGANRHRDGPKTENAKRGIVLPVVATKALREHKTKQTEECLLNERTWPAEYNDLVFVTSKGTPIDPSNLRKQTAAVARKAGIPWKVTPYELRHTATSLLADAGVSDERLADLLGHRTTKMVETHYQHVIVDALDTAERMDEILDDGS